MAGLEQPVLLGETSTGRGILCLKRRSGIKRSTNDGVLCLK